MSHEIRWTDVRPGFYEAVIDGTTYTLSQKQPGTLWTISVNGEARYSEITLDRAKHLVELLEEGWRTT
jgi:hypothetical protein